MSENINANTPETGLAVVHDIVGQVLLPADLSALDALITKLGERSAHLGAEEKAAAVKAVEDWDESVTTRIKTNAALAHETLGFLEGTEMSGETVARCANLFHDVIGDTQEYLAYVQALERCMDVRREQPVDEPVTSNMTVEEVERSHMENRAARLKWQRLVDEADARYNRAVKAYIKALAAMPETKDAMSRLRAYARKASRLAAECSDKAARAKVNISISDEDTRKLLHELMDFAKKF